MDRDAVLAVWDEAVRLWREGWLEDYSRFLAYHEQVRVLWSLCLNSPGMVADGGVA